MIAFILIVLLPGAALWPWLKSVRSLTALHRSASAIGFGLAISSTAFLLWRLAGGRAAAYPFVDPLAWTAIGATGIYRSRRARIRIIERPCAPAGFWAIGALATLLAGLCGAMLLDWIRAHPYGRWDAWAIWNLRARFLMAESGGWRKAFDAALAHPDYPLLLPSAVARAWVLSGRTGVVMPIAISLSFASATVVVVAASLWESRGPAVAAMGMLLVAVPVFVLLGASQMADVPLAFYTVLAVSMLAVRRPDAARLALAGAAMGFAAWTKNEGLVVASVLPVCYVLVRLRREGFTAASRTAINLAVGLAPVLAIVVLFKILLAPENDLVAGFLKPGAMAHWFEWGRIRFVARYMARSTVSWGGWPIGGPLWLLALLMLVPRGATRPREPTVSAVGVYLAVQLAVFYSVYVMTPYPVAWHLQTSWFRLIAQMWPTLVWWVCSTRGHAEDVDA